MSEWLYRLSECICNWVTNEHKTQAESMKTNPGTFAEVLRKRHSPFPLTPWVEGGACGCFFCAQEGKACLSEANAGSGIKKKTRLQHLLSTWIQLCLKLISHEHEYPFDFFVFDL